MKPEYLLLFLQGEGKKKRGKICFVNSIKAYAGLEVQLHSFQRRH